MPDLTPVVWRKSSRSGSAANNCVETARGEGWVAVRDSKNPAGPALVFAAGCFGAFLRECETTASAAGFRD